MDHREYKEGDSVFIHWPDKDAGPTGGTICGIATRHIVNIWIVRFDEGSNPYPEQYPYSCAALPGSMLQPVPT